MMGLGNPWRQGDDGAQYTGLESPAPAQHRIASVWLVLRGGFFQADPGRLGVAHYRTVLSK